MDTLFIPFRVASSRPARRAYITTFLLTTSATFLLFLAAGSYITFYMRYIPHLSHRHSLYLQFSPNRHPTVRLELPAASSTAPKQHYTVTLHLHLPTTPTNYALGNFMTELTLFNSRGHTLSQVRRPSTLTHRTPLLETLDTLLRAPLYLTGLRTQSQHLTIPLLDAPILEPLGSLKLTLEAEKLTVYEAAVEFRAKFGGLRWWMYNRRITMFLIGTAVFWGFELMTMAVVWWAVWAWFGSGKAEDEEGRGPYPSPPPEEEGGELYADDEETETEEEKAERGGPDVSVDSGLGSMSESASSSRARAADAGQRRRRSRGRD